MDNSNVFSIEGHSEYIIYSLTPEKHTGYLQDLFEKCSDYVFLVDGHKVLPDAAENTFQETPPGYSTENKFVYGIFNQNKALVGLLEGMRHYPEQGTWWIGLLLIIPEARGEGLGRRVVNSFAEFVRNQRGEILMLGVVEDNLTAFQFWQEVGFDMVRLTEPRRFGQKMQRVFVMRRCLE